MSTTTKDMTQKQFSEACKRRGFKGGGWGGYFQVFENIRVSYLNAPKQTWRGRLAYLIQEAEKYEREKPDRLREQIAKLEKRLTELKAELSEL